MRNAAGLVEYSCAMASVNSLNVESRHGSSDGVCEGEVCLPSEISLVIKVSCFSQKEKTACFAMGFALLDGEG